MYDKNDLLLFFIFEYYITFCVKMKGVYVSIAKFARGWKNINWLEEMIVIKMEWILAGF